MIKMLRIDDRLLHGQVAFVWKNYLGISRILVANDELMQDPMQQVTMKMAVPDGVKLLIKDIAGAQAIINDERSKTLQLLVVVKNPKDAVRMIKGIYDTTSIAHLNIGNSGRIDKNDRKVLTKEVYVDEEDIQALETLLEYPIPFEIQMTPTSSKVEVRSALEKFRMED